MRLTWLRYSHINENDYLEAYYILGFCDRALGTCLLVPTPTILHSSHLVFETEL